MAYDSPTMPDDEPAAHKLDGIMNRRGFLALLAGTALAPVIPDLSGVLPEPIRATSALERLPLERFDFDRKIGLGAQKWINGVRYRHAILLPAAAWEGATPEMREEFWGYVEQALDQKGVA